MRPTYSSQAIASTSSSNGIHADETAIEEDEIDCPLCLDPLDSSDLGFKPCPCGYQICSFCYNHIRQNLNGRCPACRKEYDTDDVEQLPVDPEEVKRIERLKKKREREKNRDAKDNRKALEKIRVKQKTQAHIQGITYRVANEDTINMLQSHDWFGQYGKILKLFLAKRTNMPEGMAQSALADPRNIPVNVYINFATTREASACISSCDGAMTPDGQFRMRAGWGTTKYCPSFLRNQRCNADNCMMAHELGEEMDPVGGAPGPVTREELSTLKHAMKMQDSREPHQARPSTSNARPAANAPGLPPTASWAKPPNSAGNVSLPPISSSLLSSSSFPLPSATTQIAPQPHKHSTSLASNTTAASNGTSSSAKERMPKPTVHPLPARPPSVEAHAAAAASAARSKHGSISGSIASTARRASGSSSSDERANHSATPSITSSLSPRKSHLMEVSTNAAESPTQTQEGDATPTPFKSKSRVAASSISKTESPSSDDFSTPNASQARQSSLFASTSSFAFPPLAATAADETDFDNPLRSFANGSFSFNLDLDVAHSAAKGKARETDRADDALDNVAANSDFMFGSFTDSLASGLPGVGSSLLGRTDSEQSGGYTGSFDPFAESVEEEQAARPKASRFGFAKKGLFGSSDSLQALANLPGVYSRSNSFAAGNSMLGVTGLPVNGLKSHSPALVPLLGLPPTPPRSHSPQGSLLSPPGLSSVTDSPWQVMPVPTPSSGAYNRKPAPAPLAVTDFSPAFSRTGTAPPPSAAAYVVPLSSAALQPLPPPLPSAVSTNPQLASAASASLPPGFGQIARQALQPLPPSRHSMVSPPGLGNKEDMYGPMSSGMHNAPTLTDPAILNMSVQRYPTPHYQQQQQQAQNFGAGLFQQTGQQQQQQNFGGQQQQQLPPGFMAHSMNLNSQQAGLLRR